MMEAVRYIPEGSNLQTRRRETLKSHNIVTLNLCFFFIVRDQVLHPYKATGKSFYLTIF
jgi:hypothetical protein